MRIWRVSLACAAVLLAASMGSAQVMTTGGINVIVEDESGARVPGATVLVESTEALRDREVVADAQGEAKILQLNPSTQYVVTVTLGGFKTAKRDKVRVSSGQTTILRVGLELGGLTEEILVTGETPVVDTTKATVGQDITLQLTESLPTGRSYQDYLQLVPGVLPTDVTSLDGGNPAAKSGLNYRDVAGDLGVSRDNFYYIDGINVTDGVAGTFGANMNTEIIQEQKVLTGGLPAEYAGAPGLVSNVITKSGSNDFHGSANYFFQNDSLQSANKNFEDEVFSTYDTAVTLGGPVLRDKAWFFGSFRRVGKDTDVHTLDTGEFMRTVERTSDQGYARLSVAPTANDTLVLTYLGDPTEQSGSTLRDTTNARDTSRVEGGHNYNARYSRLFGGTVSLEVFYGKHNGEVSRFTAIDEAFNTVIYQADMTRTLADEQLGGNGLNTIDQRDTESFKAALQASIGQHSISAGLEYGTSNYFQNRLNPYGTWYSFTPALSGITGRTFGEGSYSDSRWTPFNTSDYNGLINGINASPNRAGFYSAWDTNGDGVISSDEMADGLVWNSSAGNPHGQINYERTINAIDGPKLLESSGLVLYAQDSFQTGNFTANFGVRAEKFKHFASDETLISFFEWTFAPRLSMVWDVKGDGSMKATGYYGRYYDPIRNNMTSFAGSLTGAERHEQVYANGEWITFRVRGGPQFQDALFTPTTKTPWTEDIMLGYQADLGQDMSFELVATKRRTRDIMEDYDQAEYAFRDDGTTNYPGPVDHPDSLFLGLDYFGYSSWPESNFVIGTLFGAERNYEGVDLIFRKRFSDNWQALVSYTWSHADGNSNSDSNADLQGDILYLDPRAPGQFGDQPGTITHLIKLAGSYQFDMGLQLGAVYSWNSGTWASRTQRSYGRNLPLRATPDQAFDFAGFNYRWLLPDNVGVLRNPSFGLLNLRVQYRRNLGEKLRGELFADVFNALDEQGSTRDQDVLAGTGGIAFGEPIYFNLPRRLYLGARVSF
jgi:hypothetical protein